MATVTASQPTPAHELKAAAAPAAAPLDADAVPRGPVTVVLNFYAPPADGAVPYGYVETPPEGVAQSNYGVDPQTATINDARGRETEFNLDDNSFAFISGVESAERDFVDDESIRKNYYPEVEQLILDNVPGSHLVVIFDHTIRRANADRAVPGTRGPVTRVHIDQTPEAARLRVERHAPAGEAAALLAGRYRIINVWRPLNGPVVASPLAFADGSKVRHEDVIPVEHRYPDRVGYTAGVAYHPDQRWYYLSGIRNDERVLIKCSDSAREYGRVPHSAFVDPRTPEGAPSRESIEVRALVFG